MPSRPQSVSQAQSAKASGGARMPSAANARRSRLACQSPPPPRISTSVVLSIPARERALEQGQVQPPAREGATRLERAHQYFRRAEQHRVDGVEIALHRSENFLERPPVVSRGRARQALGELGGVIVWPGD